MGVRNVANNVVPNLDGKDHISWVAHGPIRFDICSGKGKIHLLYQSEITAVAHGSGLRRSRGGSQSSHAYIITRCQAREATMSENVVRGTRRMSHDDP